MYARAGFIALLLLFLMASAACGRVGSSEPRDVSAPPTAATAPTPMSTSEETPTSVNMPQPSPTAAETFLPLEEDALASTPTKPPAPANESNSSPDILVEDARYENNQLGIVWERPDDNWSFTTEAIESADSQLQPLIAMEHQDSSKTVFLSTLNMPAAMTRMLALELDSNPDVVLDQMTAQMGFDRRDTKLTEVGGVPAILAELDGVILWTIIHPNMVLYLGANGFDNAQEVRPLLDGLAFSEVEMDVEATPQDELPPEEQRARLVDTAESIRQLDSLESVPFEVMSRSDVRSRLENDIEREIDPEEIAAEDSMLKLLGLIPAETDLLALYLDLYSSQIAGFYEPDEGTFYLVHEGNDSESLDLMSRITFVHEYVHALQDQHFDLRRYTDRPGDDALTHDASRAFQALVEGDAQWATTLYVIGNVTLDEMSSMMETGSEVDAEVLARTPLFLQESLTFPYLYGMSFIQSRHADGGWESVNQLWESPPQSTEQILHPDRYPDDQPIEVTLPTELAADLGTDWREALRDVWGEYDLLLMLQQEIEGATASSAAEGWGGDSYLYLSNGTRGVFVVEFAWDSENDAEEAERALREWLEALGLSRAGAHRLDSPERAAYLRGEGTGLRLIMASEPEDLARIVEAMESQE